MSPVPNGLLNMQNLGATVDRFRRAPEECSEIGILDRGIERTQTHLLCPRPGPRFGLRSTQYPSHYASPRDVRHQRTLAHEAGSPSAVDNVIT